MFCKNCGNKIDENKYYCTECGSKIQRGNDANQYKNDSLIWLRVIYGVIFVIVGLAGIMFGHYQYIFMLFFGISLYPSFYSLFKIKKSNSTFYQIMIPLILMSLFVVTNKIIKNNETLAENLNNTPSQTVLNKDNNEANISKDKEVGISENSSETTENKKMLIRYEELGDYGRYEEYENKQKVFYYFPDGDYKIVLTEKNDKLCFLWIEYNKKNKSEFGSQYDVKERLQFSENQRHNYVTMSSDLHIYNSNNCNYELFKG